MLNNAGSNFVTSLIPRESVEMSGKPDTYKQFIWQNTVHAYTVYVFRNGGQLI